jgi:predicted nucleotidyltransferase
MKHYFVILIAFFILFKLGAQTVSFEQIAPLPPMPSNIADFNGVCYSSVAFIDVDKDNDWDVIICGDRSWYKSVTKLYINNGKGSFVERTGTAFDAVRNGSISVGDVDGDNDVDVLITGENNSVSRIARLYKNDGVGNFTKVSNTIFQGVMYSSSDFADVDKDGDLDVIISGFDNNSKSITNLYLNDKFGNFTLALNTPFVGVKFGEIKFADVDKDNDPDLFISGEYILNLYKNDGKGTFTLAAGAPFSGVARSSLAVADIDNDNDLDLFAADAYKASIYKNDGLGNFTLFSSTSVAGVDFGSVAFADLDGDNDSDLLVSGDLNPFDTTDRSSRIYKNDGAGNFTLLDGNSLLPIMDCGVAIADVDGDADMDIIISGEDKQLNKHSLLYVNNGTGNFAKATGSVFVGVTHGQVAFADMDGDKDQDVLVIGKDLLNKKLIKTYKNDGTGNYSVQNNLVFDGIEAEDALLFDYDSDNDPDIVLAAGTNLNFYNNDGTGTFNVAQSITVYSYGLTGASIANADIDNDGDSDLLLTSPFSSCLYTNNGKGLFTLVENTVFSTPDRAAIAFSDVDGDNDKDLVIAGEGVTELYLNSGTGNFTLNKNASFTGVTDCAIAFNDIDRDGDQDFVLTGEDVSKKLITQIYKNDGKGSFAIDSESTLDGVDVSCLAFVDVDQDRDDDLILSGNTTTGAITKLYQNDGYGKFSSVVNMPFDGVAYGSIAFADVDGDIDMDVLISGSGIAGPATRLYRNTSCTSILRTDKIVACNTYKWIDGKTYTQDNNKATYTTSTNNCNALVYLDLTIKKVNVNVSLNLNNNTLTANVAGAAYRWFNCTTNQFITGATSQSYTTASKGLYSVEVTTNGCIAQSVCVSNISTAIEGPSEECEVSVYPNPTQGLVNVDLGSLRNASINVYSSFGDLVYSNKVVNQPSCTFSLNVANGIYFVQIVAENYQKTSKVVVGY